MSQNRGSLTGSTRLTTVIANALLAMNCILFMLFSRHPRCLDNAGTDESLLLPTLINWEAERP